MGRLFILLKIATHSSSFGLFFLFHNPVILEKDKGKPAERQGRKAMGLPGKPNGCHAAGLLFGCLGTFSKRRENDAA
ncbi:hypothetical protein BN1002_00427 [Bacillus sp. B-jedd]|nr:hypothetical protein BN1002_00427 [Bacillus sp. B-jedd]